MSQQNKKGPNRRSFIAGSTAIGAISAASNAAVGSESVGPSPIENTQYDLSELSITELQAGLASGKFTAKSLVEKYIARIGEIDEQLGCVMETNPEAMEIAERLDRERAEGKVRGPLHGIPIMVKDNLDSADKMKTTAGSLALVDTPKPKSDSFVVRKLREAGAVLLGKTNLSEWANIRSTSSTSGWSARRGQTNNPYALDRNPCGSSSGSGVAAASSLCAATIGTETNGSIVCPSACCSLVGIKPTVGLVSRAGIIPISHSQDTAGPMARSVSDAAMVLSAIVGVDPEDSATSDSGKHLTNYTKFLDVNGLQGAKIGVARNFMGFHDGVERVIEAALEILKTGGAELIDTEGLSVCDEAGPAETTVLQYELKNDMATYLARLGPDSPMKTLKDLIDFNEANKDLEMPYFGQEFFLEAQEKGDYSDYEYIEARAKCLRLTRTEGIDKVMDEHELDCFVAPTMSIPCRTDLVNGDNWLGFSTSPAAVAGYPSVTVPAGYVFGLPVGMSFFGRAWCEGKLIKLAYAFEQLAKVRVAPKFLPTANLDVSNR